MVDDVKSQPRYAEFFAGGGMVSAALADRWDCVFANDIDAKKCETYRANFPQNPLSEGDIATVSYDALMQPIDLYWASSPCQDFSLAGKGKGLFGARSSTFHHWADKLDAAVARGFAPRIVAFENVVGLLSRKGAADFHTVLKRIVNAGYRVGPMEIDAAGFLPHSRPRLFVVAVRNDVMLPPGLTLKSPSAFHTSRIQKSHASAPAKLRSKWIWWNLARPTAPLAPIAEIIDTSDTPIWFKAAELKKLLSLMPPAHRDRLNALKAKDTDSIGFAYKRGRPDAAGRTRQVAEVRFDGVAGCIRTPAGGSSRQIVIVAGQGKVRARLLAPREAVRLMGLADSYVLPDNFNDAYRIAGDGVAVPVVRFLDQALFTPLLSAALRQAAA